MTRDEQGRRVMVPVSLAGLVVVWCLAVALIFWETVGGGPPDAAEWGLLASCAAAAWTVLYGMQGCMDRHQEMVRRAFELGQDAGSADVQRIR